MSFRMFVFLCVYFLSSYLFVLLNVSSSVFCLYGPICLSNYLSAIVCLPKRNRLCLDTYRPLSACLPGCLSACLSVHLPFFLCVYMCISVFFSVYILGYSVCVYLSFCLSAYVFPYVCLPITCASASHSVLLI